MKEDLLKQLMAPFKLKARRGQGGQTFYYVPSDDVIERMNTVFKGEWCTEVIDVRQEEGYIIAHVRVSVVHPDKDISLFHDGFASQYIARYTDGPRRGQIVDLGNSYKAAISKAIKVACSRFGVGLKLDPELNESNQDDSGFSPPVNLPSNEFPINETNAINSAPAKIDTPTTSVESDPQVATPEFPPVDVNQPIITEPNSTLVNETQVQQTDTPTFPNEQADNLQSVLPDIPENVVGPNMNEELGENKLTPVQETAIRVILEQYNIKYEDLAQQALNRDDFPPLEELDYKDAVQILHYGNNIGKN